MSDQSHLSTRTKAASAIMAALMVGLGLVWLTKLKVDSPKIPDAVQAPSPAVAQSLAKEQNRSSLGEKFFNAIDRLTGDDQRASMPLSEEDKNRLQALLFTHDLQPTEQGAEFLKLPPGDFEKLRAITTTIRQDVLAHEAAIATAIPPVDHDYVCVVPADPEFGKRSLERFKQEVGSLIGAEGAEALAPSAWRRLNDFTSARRFSFDRSLAGDRTTLKCKIEQLDKKGRPQKSSWASTTMRETDGRFVDFPFLHLFNPR
jgi:hypothetical protein